MKLWQAGIPNAVALLGTAVTSAHVRLLAQARSVVLFLDADEVGDHATEDASSRRIHPDLRNVRGPPGSDPAELPEAHLIALLTGVLSFPTPCTP
jgi:DNA primase